MEPVILTNNTTQKIKSILINFAAKADTIKIASAFFSDKELITNWLEDSLKQIDLLISLRPPTNYDALNKIYSKSNLSIHFLGSDFHSKFFIFYRKRQPFACVIGSSNFTVNGIDKNIETNAILTTKEYLIEIDIQFKELWQKSYLLKQDDLNEFKKNYDFFQEKNIAINNKQIQFENKILANRKSENKTVFVLTGRDKELILKEGGSQSWRIDTKRARKCKYVVCIQNHKQEYFEIGPLSPPHHTAFLVGKITDVIKSEEVKNRKKLLFNEYAEIYLEKKWPGNRNPVFYGTLEDIGIDLSTLEFQPI